MPNSFKTTNQTTYLILLNLKMETMERISMLAMPSPEMNTEVAKHQDPGIDNEKITITIQEQVQMEELLVISLLWSGKQQQVLDLDSLVDLKITHNSYGLVMLLLITILQAMFSDSLWITSNQG